MNEYKISVIIPRYAQEKWVLSCLKSLHSQTSAPYEIIIVDNNISDKINLSMVNDVKLIRPNKNLGFAKGINLGAKHASGNYLFFLNDDVTLSEDCIEIIKKYIYENPEIDIIQPKILVARTKYIQTLGYCLHASGIHSNIKTSDKKIVAPCGAAMIIKASTFRELKGFDEDYFMYGEDLELGWRATLCGYRIAICPSAIIYHDYKIPNNPTKLYYINRNRMYTILKTYPISVLVSAAPLILLAETAIFTHSVLNGWLKEYLFSHICLIKKLKRLLYKRKRFRPQIKNKQIIRLLSCDIDLPIANKKILKVLSVISKIYLRQVAT